MRGPLARLREVARRTRALGAVPDVVSLATLRLELQPATEAAAAFAAAEHAGPLATSLAAHVDRAAGTPRSGLVAFGDEWAPWFPSLARSLRLVEAAAHASPADRGRALDRARAAVLEGTREQAAAFAADLHGPATALYAFGVLLPLALVGVLPAARIAGVRVSLPLFVVGYDVLLPLALCAASAWLLARRPIAFPPTPVSRDHPDVPDRRWPAVACGAMTGACAWLLTPYVLPAWFAPLLAVGGGVGAALAVGFRPFVRVRERVRAVEEGIPDALALVGGRVADGAAVEAALDGAADDLSAPVASVLDAAVRRQRQLRIGVREAFLGSHGALESVPSPRVRGAVSLLAVAASEGRPAGATVVSLADHLDELLRVEAAARRELRRVTDTMANTAVGFAPLVAGATVAMADRLSPPSAVGSAMPTPALGLAVGCYLLVLAAILVALATGLERGFDRPLVGYRVGVALLSATAVYPTAFVAAGLLT